MSALNSDDLKHVDEMAEQIINDDDEAIASRIVGLLIFDKGNLNKYAKTLEIVIKVLRRVEEMRRGA